MDSLAEEFPKEQARVRELLDSYKEIGAPGRFGTVMIKGILKKADKAMASGDVVEIMRAFKEMQGCE